LDFCEIFEKIFPGQPLVFSFNNGDSFCFNNPFALSKTGVCKNCYCLLSGERAQSRWKRGKFGSFESYSSRAAAELQQQQQQQYEEQERRADCELQR
jgi:hypothetical protein